jgi:hypothetical protein
VLDALVTLAAEAAEEESSKVAFYIAGSVLAVAAVIVSAVGIRSHATFPPSRSGSRAVIGLFAVLVAITVGAAIITG